jgi:hypothetical protein
MENHNKLDNLGLKLLLFDVYGSLLTEKQQQTLALTYNEDLSLGEIASLLGISRQAVFDSIRRSEELLQSYDEKLGLIRRNAEERELCRRLAVAEESADWQGVRAVREQLGKILEIEN